MDRDPKSPINRVEIRSRAAQRAVERSLAIGRVRPKSG